MNISKIAFVVAASLIWGSPVLAQYVPFVNFISEIKPKVQEEEKIEDYEAVINEYTKYLANTPKEVKEEEMRHIGEISKIDREIAKLRHKKALLNSKLSQASRSHQNTKISFEQRLNSLSKINRKYSEGKISKNYKSNKDYKSNLTHKSQQTTTTQK
jgi:hypothetical protein